MTSDPPVMRPYGRHLLICAHGDCADPEAAARLQQRFRELAHPLGLTGMRYLHGLFANPDFRRAWLHFLGWQPAAHAPGADPYARLADEVERVLNPTRLAALLQTRGSC